MTSSIGQKPYLLLSATFDEILSWMIEIWMQNQLIIDSNCNTANLYSKKLQGMTNNIGLTFSVSDTKTAVYNYYCARQLESVTLNIIFSVLYVHVKEE